MTKKARMFWLIYATFIGALAILAIFTSFSSGTKGHPVVSLFNAASTAWYLTGVVGYAYQCRIGPRGLWVWALWLNLFGYVVFILMAIRQGTLQAFTVTFISVGIMLPLIYALYEYRKPSNPLWQEWESIRNSELLATIPLSEGPVEASGNSATENGEITHHASIENVLGTYVVRLRKEVGGKAESFLNEFSELDAAIKFVETNTTLRLSDFRSTRNAQDDSVSQAV